MSAKELGQIHQVNDIFTSASASGSIPRRFDLARGLSDKLQRMVRQGNYFKLVGLDMSINPDSFGPGNGGTVSGYFRYYSPTKGRCAAFRHAFKAQADQMKMQGVPMRVNEGYDFRVSLTNTAGLTPNLANQATLDGTNGLALYESGSPGLSIFTVYNASVLPTLNTTPAGNLFDEGFDTLLQNRTGGTDFVLNDTPIIRGNENYADESFERIPFQIEYQAGDSATATFQWRPDPALYVAVMTGNLEIILDNCQTSGAGDLDFEITFYVSGWKSIMGNPDKKKKSRRSMKKKR